MRIQLKALTAYWQKSSARKNPATANAHIAENDEKYTSVAFYSLPVLWGFYDVRFKRQQKLNELQKLQNQLHQLSPRSSNEYNSTYPHPATHSQAAKNRLFFFDDWWWREKIPAKAARLHNELTIRTKWCVKIPCCRFLPISNSNKSTIKK